MKPFLHGRKTADATPLRPAHRHVPVPPATGAVRPEGAASGPSVETVKQGDKVVRIIVTCSCGERIEVDCLYPPGS